MTDFFVKHPWITALLIVPTVAGVLISALTGKSGTGTPSTGSSAK